VFSVLQMQLGCVVLSCSLHLIPGVVFDSVFLLVLEKGYFQAPGCFFVDKGHRTACVQQHFDRVFLFFMVYYHGYCWSGAVSVTAGPAGLRVVGQGKDGAQRGQDKDGAQRAGGAHRGQDEAEDERIVGKY